QNYALFPHMTAAKNVLFPLKMRRFPRKDMQARADKILDLVGLARFAERYPRERAGGQQQRVALARGLVFDPAVGLLAEPPEAPRWTRTCASRCRSRSSASTARWGSP